MPKVSAKTLTPMLATAFAGNDLATFLASPEHMYELKLDGVRLLADAQKLHFRSGRDASPQFPEILAALGTLPGAPCLDGELVAFDAEGKPSFDDLARRLHGSQRRGPAVTLVAFDLVRLEGKSLLLLPFAERRALLERVLENAAPPLRLQTVFDDGRALHQFCLDNALEGVMRKRRNSVYTSGPRRTQDWMKLKLTTDEDYVVVAIVKGDNRSVGALDVASIREGALHYEGRVGSGLDDAALALAERWLLADRCAPYPLVGPEHDAGDRTFVLPKQLVRVRFHGRTSKGIMRHAVFRGLRDDITLADAFTDD